MAVARTIRKFSGRKLLNPVTGSAREDARAPAGCQPDGPDVAGIRPPSLRGDSITCSRAGLPTPACPAGGPARYPAAARRIRPSRMTLARGLAAVVRDGSMRAGSQRRCAWRRRVRDSEKEPATGRWSAADKLLDFRKVTINDLPQSAVYLAGGRFDGMAVAARADQTKTAALPAGLNPPSRV